MSTIKELASEMSRAFESGKRDNGEDFRKLRDGHPDWMRDVCYEAHGDMFPDDFIYDAIENAVDWIAENGDPDETRESFDAEPDVYTADLLRWLGSSTDRVGRADEALEEGAATTIAEACAYGQARERDEVFYSVASALRDRADEDEDDGEESNAAE